MTQDHFTQRRLHIFVSLELLHGFVGSMSLQSLGLLYLKSVTLRKMVVMVVGYETMVVIRHELVVVAEYEVSWLSEKY